MDFTPFFDRYRRVVQKADAAFATIKRLHPESVTCRIGCSDCCFALFDISLIEALYINDRFYSKFKGKQKDEMLERANEADRRIYRIKRKAYKYHAAGKDDVDIISGIGAERVRCPLLNSTDRCDMYEDRPITCRLYGLPISIEGVTHTCGKSGFQEGRSYQTVYMDKIHQELWEISNELVASLKTRYSQMAEMIVPLSMALLTTYDEEYLGLAPEKEAVEAIDAEEKWKKSGSKMKRKKEKRQSSILCRLDGSDT